MNEAQPAASDAIDRIAELTELIGGLAHELRNPLSTVMINLRLLAEDLADTGANIEDMRRRALHKVQVLQREAGRLQSLFDEFLSLSSPRTIDRKPTDLGRTLAQMVEFFEPLARSHGIKLSLDHDKSIPPVAVDEGLIRQSLLNLLVNAQQAMPVGGTIKLRCARDGDDVVITVQDSGVGIPESQIERIQRPFFSTKPDGNGLGLSIVRRIAEDHGGRLELASTAGVGTAASLRLPV